MIASSLTNSKSALQRGMDRALSTLAGPTLRVTAVGAFVLFVPAMASAQGTSAIAGVVRDSSGAVLPGVTIEAASPALIEKVRTVVSDEKGEYKIVNLPGGTYTVIHGGNYTDNRELLDGMQFNGEGNGRGFYFNPAAASEVSVQLGGQTAEFENGGAQANLVPKDGGNHFSGMFSFNYAGKGLLSNNLTPELQARGLKAVNTTDRTYDGNVAVGGPIQRDKLWFFASIRGFGYKNLMAAAYYNLTQNTPFYTPDVSRPAPQQQDNRSAGVRFTYQVASKDKLNISYDIQHTDLCLGCSPLVAPEATYTTSYANPNYLL